MSSPNWVIFDDGDEHTLVFPMSPTPSPLALSDNETSQFSPFSPDSDSDEEASYPTTAGPIIPGSKQQNFDWVSASENSQIFIMPLPTDKDDCKAVERKKHEHMQEYFWTALDRHNPEGLSPDGTFARVWGNDDMEGMISWYRRCLGRPSPPANTPGSDGIWKDVLKTSPWWDCLLFFHLIYTAKRDENGELVKKANGAQIFINRELEGKPELEAEFLHIWREQAKEMPLRRFKNGDIVTPLFFEAYKEERGGDGHIWRDCSPDTTRAELI
ncbi:Fc.00g011720.m01.CDS01 [Cosmosporella sp. VM-42]